MKRKFVSLGVAAFLGFLALPTSPSFLYANNAALVIKAPFCGVLDGDGGIVLPEGLITVVTEGDTRIYKCLAKGVPNSTGQAVHWDFDSTDLTCRIQGVNTTDWQETVSASGNVVLTCKVNENKP